MPERPLLAAAEELSLWWWPEGELLWWSEGELLSYGVVLSLLVRVLVGSLMLLLVVPAGS